jgi:hypothetical protein
MNKKIIIIIISVIVVISVIVGVLLITKNEEPTPTPNPAPQQPVQKHETEIINDIALNFYNSGEYLNFPMMNDNVYFASRSILRDFGYDDSFIDETCSDITPIIYFDVNHILNESYEGAPITFRTICDTTYQ